MKTLITILLLLTGIYSYAQHESKAMIENAIKREIETYPLSTLQDIYKNFFQDRFGPGHIISDTASAGRYLREELLSYDKPSGEHYESTGYLGNFYRLNLSVIKEGLIDYDTFFTTFIESINGFKPISIEEWREEWRKINTIISNMDLNIKDYQKDSIAILHLLEQGKYVMHHSKEFSEAYSPHYRIIRKDCFEEKILPLLR
jgi:hypothetical protein